MYVEEFDENTGKIVCINSWGDLNSRPVLDIDEVEKIYRVSCKAILQEDIDSLDEIKRDFNKEQYSPSMTEVIAAAKLAELGLLTKINYLHLCNIDINQIPTDEMSKLVQIVEKKMILSGVMGDIQLIFSHVECKELTLKNMRIDKDATQPIQVEAIRLFKLRGRVTSLIRNIQCEELFIGSMNFNEENTKCLIKMFTGTT